VRSSSTPFKKKKKSESLLNFTEQIQYFVQNESSSHANLQNGQTGLNCKMLASDYGFP
jgi:hypothetical protein